MPADVAPRECGYCPPSGGVSFKLRFPHHALRPGQPCRLGAVSEMQFAQSELIRHGLGAITPINRFLYLAPFHRIQNGIPQFSHRNVRQSLKANTVLPVIGFAKPFLVEGRERDAIFFRRHVNTDRLFNRIGFDVHGLFASGFQRLLQSL
jgi:hypothetical protein